MTINEWKTKKHNKYSKKRVKKYKESEDSKTQFVNKSNITIKRVTIGDKSINLNGNLTVWKMCTADNGNLVIIFIDEKTQNKFIYHENKK